MVGGEMGKRNAYKLRQNGDSWENKYTEMTNFNNNYNLLTGILDKMVIVRDWFEPKTVRRSYLIKRFLQFVVIP